MANEVYTINNLEAPIDFEVRDYVGRTLQNAKNLLCCWKGEVPYDRMMGLDPGMIDLTFPQMKNIIFDEATRALAWEPDVKVKAARVIAVEIGVLYVEVDVTIQEAA